MGTDFAPTLFGICLVVGIFFLPARYFHAFIRAHGPAAPSTDERVFGYMTLGDVAGAAFQIVWPLFCLLFYRLFPGLSENVYLLVIFMTIWVFGGIFIGMALDWPRLSQSNRLKAKWHILFYIIWPLIYLLRWRLFPDLPISTSVTAFFIVTWMGGMPIIEMILIWLGR